MANRVIRWSTAATPCQILLSLFDWRSSLRAVVGAATATERPRRPWPSPVARQRAGNYAPSHALSSVKDREPNRSDDKIPVSWR